MKTADEHLKIALGGNMHIATLKVKAFAEIMTDYAKYYHKEQNSKTELETSKKTALNIADVSCCFPSKYIETVKKGVVLSVTKDSEEFKKLNKREQEASVAGLEIGVEMAFRWLNNR